MVVLILMSHIFGVIVGALAGAIVGGFAGLLYGAIIGDLVTFVACIYGLTKVTKEVNRND